MEKHHRYVDLVPGLQVSRAVIDMIETREAKG